MLARTDRRAELVVEGPESIVLAIVAELQVVEVGLSVAEQATAAAWFGVEQSLV